MTEPNERSTERIEAALARLGADHEPPLGWEARVLAAVDPTKQRRWWRVAVPGVALAAAAAAVVAVVVVHRPPPALALNIDVKHRTLTRGDDYSAGDVAHIAVSGGKGPRAIWVYHEEVQLVLRCPSDDPRCRVSDASTEVDLTLTSVGTYTVVALTGAAHLPALAGSYDTDTAAAKDAGLDVREHQLTVR